MLGGSEPDPGVGSGYDDGLVAEGGFGEGGRDEPLAAEEGGDVAQAGHLGGGIFRGWVVEMTMYLLWYVMLKM